MTIRIALLAAAFVLAAAPAIAGQCPLDMKKIDAALAKGTTLSEYKLDQVKELRAEGEKLHKDGKHVNSIKTLAKAKTLLGIE